MPASRLFRVEEAAQILGVHSQTVRDYCNEGLLACTRTAGGHRRISWAAIEVLTERLLARARVTDRAA